VVALICACEYNWFKHLDLTSFSRRVSEIDVVFCKTRVDGTQVRLAEILVGDESGCVSLRARDQQIDLLKAVSGRQGAIVARNATIELYQGRYIRLVVTKWGKLSEYPDAISSTPKPPQMTAIDRNYSLIDLSRLAMNDSESPTGTGRRTSGYQYPASQETRLSNSRRHAQASRLVNVAPENQFQPMLQYNSAYMSAPQYAYSYSDQDRHQLLMAQQYGFQQQHMQHQQSSQANTNIHATARMGFNQAGNSFFFAHQSRIPQQTRPSTPPNTESLVLTPQTPQMNPSAATFSPQSSQDGERRP